MQSIERFFPSTQPSSAKRPEKNGVAGLFGPGHDVVAGMPMRLGASAPHPPVIGATKSASRIPDRVTSTRSRAMNSRRRMRPPVDHACLPEKTNYSTFKLRGGAGEVIE